MTLDPHTVWAIVCVTWALVVCAVLCGLINGKPDA